MSKTYSLEDVPDQTGKNIIITGASAGIGLTVAKILAMKGGQVIMACRNLDKAKPLADAINTDAAATGGKATVLRLDTTDLASIDSFVKELSVDRLDSVVLNAGIMAVAYREVDTRSTKYTKMESQMACNVVGHFYLVHVLTSLLKASPGVRIVSVASASTAQTKAKDSINYDVFTGLAPEKYSPMASYSESKLANLFLVHELQRRFKAAEIDGNAVAAHPGYTRTTIQDSSTSWILKVGLTLTRMMSMPMEGGALILCVAATLPKDQLPEKPYFAPSGLLAFTGPPSASGVMPAHGRDNDQAKKLWEKCEELCGVETSI